MSHRRLKQIGMGLTGLGLLAGCGTSPDLTPRREIQIKPLAAETLAPETVIDTGRAAGGSLRLQFKFEPAKLEGFKTMLGPCTINANLQSFRIFLLDGTTSLGNPISLLTPILTLPSIALPNSSTWYTVEKGSLTSPSGTQSVTLKNVGTGRFYVGVAAFSGAGGTGSNLASFISGLLAGGTLGPSGFVSVTNGGGDPSQPGSVRIGPGPTYPILAGSATLTVLIKLSSLGC